jgi:ribosomal protein S18 acetylase RimI-like enzyme
VTVDLREVASGDYEYLIGRVDDWWGGRSMAPMLPRLFFDHFPATTRIACDADDGATLGFVCGFVSQADPRVAYIHFVGVDPAARGRDVGRTLYRWFAAQARARGCTSIACVTSPVNTGSRAFHAAMGFSAKTVENYDGRGEDRVVFHLDLTDPSLPR